MKSSNFPIKFMHLADLHLGKRQYNIEERYNDYFRAFKWILSEAIQQNLDFILVSGDLIDSDQGISPSVLRDIISILQTFKEDCTTKLKRLIPIICIEGNHEDPFFSDHTWLKLLADLELTILLSGEYNTKNNSLSFSDYTLEDHSGGRIRIKNVNIYGVSYFGSSTPELFPLINKEIKKEKNQFNIVMMHFGISTQDKRKTGIDISRSLRELNKSVDYLALGHFHKQYVLPEKNPWIFNPGSLENNEITELESDRGAFLVEIYEDSSFKVISYRCQNGSTSDPLSIPNRMFFTSSPIDISETKSFQEAKELVVDRLKRIGLLPKPSSPIPQQNLDVPMLYFTLGGIIDYSQLEINITALRERLTNEYNILGVKILNKILSTMDEDVLIEGDLTYDEIEKQIFLSIIENEPEFKLNKDKIFDLFLFLKKKLVDKPQLKSVTSYLDNWFDSNIHLFSSDFKNLENKRKQKKKIEDSSEKGKKKEKRKIKKVKKKTKQELIAPKMDLELELDATLDLMDILDKDEEEGKEKEEEVEDDIIDDGDIRF